MNRLCDEILQLILNELDDPTNFSIVSKSIHAFTQDPYVRASYFISRYGKIQAFYWAFGRGKLINKSTVDILLSSGAQLSRYLVQCIIQHYFRSLVHFIKTPWVRTLNYEVVAHILSIAATLYGQVPVSKGDDDGAVFMDMLKESRLPAEQRTIKYETAKTIVEKYKFIPFCHRDPMMAQFPLVLAIEPRLLPFARANGFRMDSKYRNFVFRKMFEKPAFLSEGRSEEIINNVRELSRLDSQMFLSRTVAAEICMEAKVNESAYEALKTLNKEGDLKFDMGIVVQDLIKLFANTRSIGNPNTAAVLRHLFNDFPSEDSTVRVVLLLQIFLSETPMQHPGATPGLPGGVTLTEYVRSCRETIMTMNLHPVKRTDLLEVLVNKFAPERFHGILEYGKVVMGMAKGEIEGLLQEVAIRCLEIGCKGKMLKKLLETYPWMDDVIRKRVMKAMRLNVEDLPSWEDDEAACAAFTVPLCRNFTSDIDFGFGPILTHPLSQPLAHQNNHGHHEDGEDDDSEDEDLGYIGQDTLTTMIRKDEISPTRSRRRFYDFFTPYSDASGKLTYPQDHLVVGKYIRTKFGLRGGVTAVFMMHGIVNLNAQHMAVSTTYPPLPVTEHVPITFKHFKLLARLGRSPLAFMYDVIENGAEFYFGEEDYLPPEELSGAPLKRRPTKRKHTRIRVKIVSEYTVKTESSPGPSLGLTPPPRSSSGSVSAPVASSSSSGSRETSYEVKRRPRRSAASTSKSYVVPDSDDEEIADEEDEMMQHVHAQAKKRRVESNLQKWIKHLSVLLKEEQKKYNEKRKRAHASAQQGSKLRVPRSEFLRSLSAALPRLRKLDLDKRQQLYGPDVAEEDYSSGEDDEYHERTTRTKRRKIEADA